MSHFDSDRDVDFSGYVDEYGFMPLTPSLEAALSDVVESISRSSAGKPMTTLVFKERGETDELLELARLGYLDQPSKYLDGDAAFRITAKGARYAKEKESYLRRRRVWGEARRREHREDLLFQMAISLLSFLGGIVCAVVGGLL